MTKPRKVRWPRAHVRALAWVAGATTFFTGVAVLGAAGPKPAAGATTPERPRRMVIRHIIKRVVIVSPIAPAYSPPVSISTDGGTSYVAPAPPPPVSTGGSHPV